MFQEIDLFSLAAHVRHRRNLVRPKPHRCSPGSGRKLGCIHWVNPCNHTAACYFSVPSELVADDSSNGPSSIAGNPGAVPNVISVPNFTRSFTVTGNVPLHHGWQ